MASKVVSKFGSHLKELRLHLCLTGESSQGVRDFVGSLYNSVKKTNPELPILIREAKGIEPKLWARFEYGREKNMSLSGLTGEQVLQKIETIAKH